MKQVIELMKAVSTPVTHEQKLMLDHWHIGLPNQLKCCIYQWRERSYEQKMYVYLNPSPKFISQNAIFLAEMEKHNH